MLTLSAVLDIFVYGMIAAMLGTILPELSKRFSLTPKQNANIAMAQAIGLMCGSFFVGPLNDVQGSKVGLLLGLGLITGALLGLKFVSSYGGAAGFMLMLGTGGGAIVVSAFGLPGHIKISTLSTAGSSIC